MTCCFVSMACNSTLPSQTRNKLRIALCLVGTLVVVQLERREPCPEFLLIAFFSQCFICVFSESPPFRQPASAAHHAHQLHSTFLPDIFFVGDAEQAIFFCTAATKHPNLHKLVLNLEKVFPVTFPVILFILSDSVQAWLHPRQQDLPCPICASADSFSKSSIAATSWPDRNVSRAPSAFDHTFAGAQSLLVTLFTLSVRPPATTA